MNQISFANKKCLNCEKPLVGRSDKKFCDHQCRSSFNNRGSSQQEKLINDINKVLRRNRRILKMLCPVGKTTVRQEVAVSMGFDFTIFTSIFSTKTGVYYFSYDYGFCPVMESGKVRKMVIAQKQSYMEASWDPWKYVK